MDKNEERKQHMSPKNLQKYIRRIKIPRSFSRGHLFSILTLWTILLFLWKHVYTPTESNKWTELKFFCEGEKMYFMNTALEIGRPFSCDLLPILRSLELTENYRKQFTAKRISEREVVFVTYSSSNHFPESRLMLRKIREQSNNTIIYYDLGLSRSQLSELSNVCNLFVKTFNYSKYPYHVNNLRTYAFKPIIMAEVLLEHYFFWMLDSSVTFINASTQLPKLYADVNSGKLEDSLMRYDTGMKIKDFTHPDMFAFFPMQKQLSETQNQKGATIFIRKSPLSMTFTKWLLLCALTEECISPRGGVLYCSKSNYGKGCHRYDQAAANLILHGLIDRAITSDVFTPLLNITRGKMQMEKLEQVGYCR